jgi:transposase
MRKNRTNYTAQEKVIILRKHLLEKIAISDICEQYELNPTLFYRWQKQFFEQGARSFEVEKNQDRSQAKIILALEQKLEIKNEVLSELMEEHIKVKKTLGESERQMDRARFERHSYRFYRKMVKKIRDQSSVFCGLAWNNFQQVLPLENTLWEGQCS